MEEPLPPPGPPTGDNHDDGQQPSEPPVSLPTTTDTSGSEGEPGPEREDAAALARPLPLPQSVAAEEEGGPSEPLPGAAAAVVSASSASPSSPPPQPALASSSSSSAPAATSTPAPATAPAPAPAPIRGPILRGVLIGLFVVLDPNKQKTQFNMKRQLEFMGIHQRDLVPGEEVQLSLEQAFYMVAELKRLEVYLPAEQPKAGNQAPLSVLACWRAFSAVSPTFVRSAGSYRHFRKQGFVVAGGLNLGLDWMLYRGSPQRYHAEFGVLLRYPPEEEAAAGQGPMTWRELHLLYRLVGEVRKTLILAHLRLGPAEEPAAAASASAASTDAATAAAPPTAAQAAQLPSGRAGASDEDAAAAREMARWFTGLSVFEVAMTAWRAGTPLARAKQQAKGKGEQAQMKKGAPGGGGGGGGPQKRGRSWGGGAAAASDPDTSAGAPAAKRTNTSDA